MQAIKDNTSPVRLSEQEGLDCITDMYSCQGGWMDAYFDMSIRMGSQSEKAYPYEAKDNACRNQDGKTVISKATHWN